MIQTFHFRNAKRYRIRHLLNININKLILAMEVKISKEYKGYKKELEELKSLLRANKEAEKYIHRRICYVVHVLKDIEKKQADEIAEIIKEVQNEKTTLTKIQ
jgi:hypothetical protein